MQQQQVRAALAQPNGANKSVLNQAVLGLGGLLPHYSWSQPDGPAHAPSFTASGASPLFIYLFIDSLCLFIVSLLFFFVLGAVEVCIPGQAMVEGRGQSNSKKRAADVAAAHAYRQLVDLGYGYAAAMPLCVMAT
jgi:dsRNA-specific ribonuclease